MRLSYNLPSVTRGIQAMPNHHGRTNGEKQLADLPIEPFQKLVFGSGEGSSVPIPMARLSSFIGLLSNLGDHSTPGVPTLK
jgi:hypothetical protein